jgi:hypothetical protein
MIEGFDEKEGWLLELMEKKKQQSARRKEDKSVTR